ncbi:hypothetical protein [Olleya aquimaris]|uniref:Uncharacterized protein n=1 Tax=Olleya aquimaris TaxID=639310 RepID=A0A327RMP1_9FLAO|nr:hypothetical protein [Olleya aquimaris]RAJ17172.1 hypothetical protein LY08_00953 [Olleya aquimaris]
MIENLNYEKASDREILLYTCLGEALCAVQILEDALSHAIVLKKTEPNQKDIANTILKKQQKYTLGKAIFLAKKESLLPEPLIKEMIKIRDERNWLIHESVIENKEDYKSNNFFKRLSEKSKFIVLKANKLQVTIELDLIRYSEKKGIDTSNIRNFICKHYGLNF